MHTRHASPRPIPPTAEALEDRLCLCSFPHLDPATADAFRPATLAAAEATPTPAPAAVRIDAGRGPHTDVNGNTWARDEGLATGGTVSTFTYEVANTFEDPLYYTRRWGNFDYAIPVNNGAMDVRLHFADPLYTQAGKRVFNVSAEGAAALSNFDIAANGGGKSALVRSFVANVADGTLNLSFRGLVENAIVSAIEVVPRAGAGWVAAAPAPVTVFEAQAVSTGGKLYAFGGFKDSLVRATVASLAYDPNANAWTRVADMPRPITHAGAAADGTAVWLAGGFVGDYPDNPATAEVWKYDTARNAWTPGPALPKKLAAGGLVKLGRELHYFGGLDAAGADSGAHYVLKLDQPAAGWTTAAPMPVPRNHLGATVLNNKIYAVGGQRGLDEVTGNYADVHVYDPATGRWSATTRLPLARSHVSASTFVANNKILVAGGVANGTGGSSRSLADVLQFDPATGRWTTLESLPGVRKAPVARHIGGRLIVATGSIGNASPQATTWTWPF